MPSTEFQTLLIYPQSSEEALTKASSFRIAHLRDMHLEMIEIVVEIPVSLLKIVVSPLDLEEMTANHTMDQMSTAHMRRWYR